MCVSTVRCLGGVSGSMLLGMTRDELKTICPEEGGRVFYQLQNVKSALAVGVTTCTLKKCGKMVYYLYWWSCSLSPDGQWSEADDLNNINTSLTDDEGENHEDFPIFIAHLWLDLYFSADVDTKKPAQKLRRLNTHALLKSTLVWTDSFLILAKNRFGTVICEHCLASALYVMLCFCLMR